MARRKSQDLTEAELEIMRVIWEAGEATAKDILHALRKEGRSISSGTVRKMLSILMGKGYLSRSKPAARFLYKAKVGRGRATKRMLGDLLKRAFGGNAALMVAALIDGRFVSEKDIEEAERLMSEREKEERK